MANILCDYKNECEYRQYIITVLFEFRLMLYQPKFMLSEQFFTQDVEFKKSFFIERIHTLQLNEKLTENTEESEKMKRMISGYKDLLIKLAPDFNFNSI